MKRILLMILCLILILNAFPLSAVAMSESGNQVGVSTPIQFESYASVEALNEIVDIEELKNVLYDSFYNCETNIDLSAFNISNTAENISNLQSLIDNEMPECFHVVNFEYWYSSGKLKKIVPNYSLSASEYQQMLTELLSAKEKILKDIKGNNQLTDVEKALIIHDRLALICEYDYNNTNNRHDCYGALVNGTAVCQGYAEAYDYLLEQVGIECYITSSAALNHAWNIVVINGKKYHVDVTWDDPVWDVSGRVYHHNFLLSSDALYKAKIDYKGSTHRGHDANDYDTSPNDTTYDNYYWQNSDAQFCLLGDEIYYIDSANSQIKTVSDSTVIGSVASTWRAGSNSSWRGNYSRLATDGESLFYSLCDAVYKLDFITGTSSCVYQPDLSIGNWFAIYGFDYRNGYLVCDLNNTPNFDGDTKDNYQVKMFYDEINYLSYEIYDGEATITDCDTSISGDIIIPSTLGGYPVTSIGSRAFAYCYGLTSITIPDSVTSIGGWAFEYCSGLTSITIGNSVTIIGMYAFSGCSGLSSVYYNGSVTDRNNISIGSYNDALTNATWYYSSTEIWVDDIYYKINDTSKVASVIDCKDSIISVTIPETISNDDKVYTITAIGDSALSGCTSLVNVNIPDGVTSIGDYAFSGCTRLTSVTIPNSVTSIGDEAFASCSGLTSITIGNSVTSIGGYAFEDCTRLTNVTIPDSVTSIGDSAFRGCSGLTSITIGNSVTSIGDYAFKNCTSLTSITIPDSVMSIGVEAFYNTDYYYDQYNWLTGGVLYIGNHLIVCHSSFNYTIREGTVTIADYAFYGSDSLTSIIIPDSVTSIGNEVFSGCSSLTSITIPDSVMSIGGYAFYGCTRLTNVTIPDSVTSIGDWAFDNTGVNYVYYKGNENDRNNISISSNNETLIDATWYYNTTRYELKGVSYVFNLINNTATIIDCADDVTSITIPATITKDGKLYTVTNIDNFAFEDCTSLTSVLIPNSVTNIGSYAFWCCDSLTDIWYSGSESDKASINFGEGDSELNNATWHYNICPDEHTYDNICDADCNLCEYVRSDNHDYDNIGDADCNLCGETRVPPIVNYLSYEIYDGEVTITDCDSSISGDITIPSTLGGYPVTSIGDDAFEDCSSLTSITIGNSVTSIGDYAFYNCYSLTSITIGNSVTSIGGEAFHICDSLKDVWYSGSVSDRANIYIFGGNYRLQNATWHYNCCKLSDTNVHTYDNDCDTTCNICGSTRIVSDHVYDNACDTECNECGNTRTITHNYKWVIDKENNCGETGIKHEECTICHATRNEGTVITATGNHKYDNDCDTDCNTCGLTRTVSDHVYDNACDTECNECGNTRTITHDYKWVIDKENNYGVEGIKHEECTICHDKRNEGTIIEAVIDENSPVISVSNASTVAGNRVKVNISLKNNPGIVSATMRVAYDSDVLTLIKVTDAGVLGSTSHKPELINPYTLVWVNDTATSNFTSNGKIVTLTFEVSENASLGKYPITISYDYDSYDIYNVKAEKVKFVTVNGYVEIIDVITGDVNNDGLVNNLDRMVLTRYLADWDDYGEDSINSVAADVNSDGLVNNLDRMVLTRHLADWDGYEELPYAG